VTIRIPFKVRLRRAQSRRLLGYVLFFLIAYGATVDVAHSHGLVRPQSSGAVAVTDANGSQSSNNGHARHRECSMCQFQQQLFGGLIHAPLYARTSLTEIPIVATQVVFLYSTSTTPQSGRAPPLV
jgi:Protein of unknown function (DUF2946)